MKTVSARASASKKDDPVARLGGSLGIEPDFWDIYGENHETSEETRRALIEAMGYAVSSEADVRESLDRVESGRMRRLLPPVSVLRAGATGSGAAVSLTHAASRSGGEALQWTLECEGGGILEGACRLEDLTVAGRREVGKDQYCRRALPLPEDVDLGYHRLRMTLGADVAEGEVIVAPPRAHCPEWLARGERLWGVVHQLYSLRSAGNWGIGDLGDLRRLAEIVGQAGGSAIGLNPLHALFPTHPEHASPYAPSSRLFRNPLYLDVAAIAEFGACEGMQALAASDPYRRGLEAVRGANLIDYSAVADLKLQALERLFAAFEAQHPKGGGSARRREFEDYLQAGGEKLRRFALYQALREHFDGGGTSMWPEAYRRPESEQSLAFADQHRSRVEYFAWQQWELDRQLAAAARQCADGGMKIGLYNDLAAGVDAEGADAWSGEQVYADARFGAPPDPFSQDGQNWGLPPLNPDALREQAYRPFVDILRANMRHAGALRIDHVMWLRQLFWIPNGGSAADGAYVRYPMDDLFGVLALESSRARCLVIGEDLGTVPEGFRERMETENVLSYRLLRFERYPDGLFRRPDTYPRLSLSMSGSHDLATVVGHWSERDIDVLAEIGLLADAEDQDAMREERARDRNLLVAALTDQKLLPEDFPTEPEISADAIKDLITAVHRFLARTPAALAMLSLEDLLAMRDQVNVPGTIDDHPNWRCRMTVELDQFADAGELAAVSQAVMRERDGLNPPEA